MTIWVREPSHLISVSHSVPSGSCSTNLGCSGSMKDSGRNAATRTPGGEVLAIELMAAESSLSNSNVDGSGVSYDNRMRDCAEEKQLSIAIRERRGLKPGE